MNYSLGNMLVNGGALNPDGLSLDLQFAADKTLTARKGPTPTFTRASTATFIGSNGLIQSAAINAPRFDHDPTTLASRGLLIEESRTNLVGRSSEPALWNLNGSTILNDVAAPDGGIAKNIALGTNLFISLGTPAVTTVAANSIATISIFLKRDNNDWMRIQWVSGTNAHTVNAWFNIGNGTLGNVSVGVGTPSNLSSSIIAYPNGWYRCTVSASSPITDVVGGTVITAASNNSITRVAGANIAIWGAQVEAGSFPTSYIPTTTASVVRSADVCSITGGDFSGFYNQSEGTLLTNAFTPASGDRTVVATDDNTANEMVRLRTEGTNPFFKVTDGGVDVVAIDSGTISANTEFKLAGAYKLNDFASSVNGGSAVTDTLGAIPTVDRMRIGSGQAGNTMCGCISSIRYYKKRLADAKLQSLTT
jgi:hypothetical protein